MNTKESIYEIRFARLDEGDAIIDFYRKYWNENHALVKSRVLFDFQHKSDKCYNIVIAYNKQTHEIDATWGLIPVSQYDRKLQKNGDYWGGILKIREDVNNNEVKGLFFRLYKFVHSLPGLQSYISCGLGEMGMKVMKPFNKINGVLNLYYIANNSKSEFSVGYNLEKRTGVPSTSSVKELDIDSIEDIPNSIYKPQKSIDYLINRFKKHPIYTYDFLGVYNKKELVAILVVRIISVLDKGNVIRIVDCVGDLSKVDSLLSDFQTILVNKGAEYVDFLNYGIDDSILDRMGFIKVDLTNDNTIVPGYFEPFERTNVKIQYAFNMKGDYTIFKADSDQDRPNII